MAIWPWVVGFKNFGQKLDDFPNLKKWFEETVGQRPRGPEGQGGWPRAAPEARHQHRRAAQDPVRPDRVGGEVAAMLVAGVDDAINDFATCDRGFPHQSVRWALDNWDEAGSPLPQAVGGLRKRCRSQRSDAERTVLRHSPAGREAGNAGLSRPLPAGRESGPLPRPSLGGAITETLKSLLISTWDGDATRLKHLIEADVADEFVGAAALDALALSHKEGRISERRDASLSCAPLAGDDAAPCGQLRLDGLGRSRGKPRLRGLARAGRRPGGARVHRADGHESPGLRCSAPADIG